MKRSLLMAVALVVGYSGLAGGSEIDPARLKRFSPLPANMDSKANPATPEKIALGRMLYFEHRISKNQAISCNTCHRLEAYGVDGEPTSPGFKSQRGSRNSPTVYNAAGHFLQFWDGRAPDVEEQAKGPVLNPVEMAMSDEKAVVAVLKSMPGYVEMFRKAFPNDKDPVTFNNYALAIGAFERRLTTPSRWDRFLKGDKTALSAAEQAGFNTFYETGCATCHSGTYMGGQMFQKAGLVKSWPDAKDTGRQQVTGKAGDKMMFKVPSLRNIEKTGPYFHDGRTAALDEAVRMMGLHELGKRLSAEEAASIVVWMKSLTGTPPAELIRPPKLPAPTAATPKPSESD